VRPVFSKGEIVIAFRFSSTRLVIREFLLKDAGFVQVLLNDPAFLRYIGDRGVRNLADAAGYLKSGPISSYREHGYGLWLVELIESRQPIGMAGLLNRDELDHCDLGFALLEEFRGMGYAFEAASVVLDYAETTLALDTVLAIVSTANHDSKKLLSRLGFRFNRFGKITPGSDDVEVFTLAPGGRN
jgi:RimJ/RimL family protein N-acetyltransferase